MLHGQKVRRRPPQGRGAIAWPAVPEASGSLGSRVRLIVVLQSLCVVGIVLPILNLLYRKRHPKPPKRPKSVRFIKRHRGRTATEQAEFERRERKRAALRESRLARQRADDQ